MYLVAPSSVLLTILSVWLFFHVVDERASGLIVTVVPETEMASATASASLANVMPPDVSKFTTSDFAA